MLNERAPLGRRYLPGAASCEILARLCRYRLAPELYAPAAKPPSVELYARFVHCRTNSPLALHCRLRSCARKID